MACHVCFRLQGASDSAGWQPCRICRTQVRSIDRWRHFCCPPHLQPCPMAKTQGRGGLQRAFLRSTGAMRFHVQSSISFHVSSWCQVPIHRERKTPQLAFKLSSGLYSRHFPTVCALLPGQNLAVPRLKGSCLWDPLGIAFLVTCSLSSGKACGFRSASMHTKSKATEMRPLKYERI